MTRFRTNDIKRNELGAAILTVCPHCGSTLNVRLNGEIRCYDCQHVSDADDEPMRDDE